jgi:Co/Zn/Cd efflux system component
LQADALDSLGDADNYVISLAVVGMALRYRAMAALAKGITMGLFGLWVIGTVIWHSIMGTVPEAITMGAVGLAALAANAACFGLLYAYRAGDANMQSVWICSRNDVLGNIAVLMAALGVFGTGAGWPDVMVAGIMATLALQGALVVVRQAWQEMHSSAALRASKPRRRDVRVENEARELHSSSARRLCACVVSAHAFASALLQPLERGMAQETLACDRGVFDHGGELRPDPGGLRP